MALPTSLELEIVTPEGLLLREPVDEVIAPGERATSACGPATRRSWPRSGWASCDPGGAPGTGSPASRAGARCCPTASPSSPTSASAPSDIDVARAEEAKKRAAERMKRVRGEAGFERGTGSRRTSPVTRLAVGRAPRASKAEAARRRGPSRMTTGRSALPLDLLRYRALIQSLVARELKARYRGSVLGFLWSFVNPLLLLLTYTLVFTVILPATDSRTSSRIFLFLFCGILPWTWFQASLSSRPAC